LKKIPRLRLGGSCPVFRSLFRQIFSDVEPNHRPYFTHPLSFALKGKAHGDALPLHGGHVHGRENGRENALNAILKIIPSSFVFLGG
jgi:hypothetical protein